MVLALIAERPRHGYEIIKEIEERLAGSYTPSPGVIYPTLTMLEELGHATISESDGKKLYAITAEGTAWLDANKTAVDNAFHYLWGGGYVIDAAKKGYIAYTACTAALAEVVPFGGKFPTLGTNPHSWGFPTTDEIGYPICIDWATSIVAMGRIQQFIREAKPVPAGWGVDENGNEIAARPLF